MVFGFLKQKKAQVEETKENFSERMERSYYKIIDECARKEKNFAIENSDSKHAKYALKAIFQNAKKEVYLVVKKFDCIFDNEGVVEAAVNFLHNPGARLFIAYQDPLVKKRGDLLNINFLVSIFAASTVGKLEIWDARESASYVNNYFFLNDKGHFRCTREGNSIANFGDKESGIKLAAIFGKIASKCPKVLG